jgi:hypothetical protein
MHFVYGFCGGSTCAAVGEYRRHFPEWRILSKGVFAHVHQTIHETDCLPSVCVLSEMEVVPDINRENNLEMLQRSPKFPLLELPLALMYCTCRCGEFYMEKIYTIMIREFNILNQETLPNIWICTTG